MNMLSRGGTFYDDFYQDDNFGKLGQTVNLQFKIREDDDMDGFKWNNIVGDHQGVDTRINQFTTVQVKEDSESIVKRKRTELKRRKKSTSKIQQGPGVKTGVNIRDQLASVQSRQESLKSQNSFNSSLGQSSSNSGSDKSIPVSLAHLTPLNSNSNNTGSGFSNAENIIKTEGKV
jgi:hypothetical protein